MICLQIDGGRTVTEPTCIMTGKPEGRENVSDISLIHQKALPSLC